MAVASAGIGSVGKVGEIGGTGKIGSAGGSGARPRVCGLASARDRARLREREAAERARVEQVLARGPMGPGLEDEEIPRTRRQRLACAAGRVAAAVLRPATCVCRLCGGSDVAVDFVRDRGTWRLARCGRCDFFWTELWGEMRTEPVAARSRGESRVIRCADASAA